MFRKVSTSFENDDFIYGLLETDLYVSAILVYTLKVRLYVPCNFSSDWTAENRAVWRADGFNRF